MVDYCKETTLPRADSEVATMEQYSPAEESEGSDKDSTYPSYIPTPITRGSAAHEPESPI